MQCSPSLGLVGGCNSLLPRATQGLDCTQSSIMQTADWRVRPPHGQSAQKLRCGHSELNTRFSSPEFNKFAKLRLNHALTIKWLPGNFQPISSRWSIVQAWLHLSSPLMMSSTREIPSHRNENQSRAHTTANTREVGLLSPFWPISARPRARQPRDGFSYPFQGRTQIFCGTSQCVAVEDMYKGARREGLELSLLSSPASSSRA